LLDPRLQETPEKSEKTAPERQDLALSRHSRLEQLVAAAFSGQLARGRDLKYWENLRLKPQHIQMLVMKGAGYKNNEIARAMDITEARVSVIVNHPDAQSVMALLVSFQAEELLDVKTRIQAHSGEALNVALEQMRNASEPAVRLKAAFGLLDRAGYGAVQRTENKHVVEIPATAARGIAAALKEAQEIEEVEFEIVTEAPDSGTGEPSETGSSESTSSEPPSAGYPGHPQELRRTA
jgi:hypothetical protein